jgi:hypothetical protein
VNRALSVLVVLLFVGAFLAGYWPQRERVSRAQAAAAEAEHRLAEARSRLAELEARDRLGRAFGRFLALEDAVASGNYGEAAGLSSAFFDAVHAEAGLAGATVRPALDAILMRRDTVTAGVARGDASVREALVPIARELRRALGHPVPPLAPPMAAPAGGEAP